MKLNWGTGIIIGMGAFMIFILQYVIRVQTNSEFDNELVTENYYQEEINIDKNHEAEKNANALGEKLTFKMIAEGMLIHFPKDFELKEISGIVSLYKASNQSLDKSINIQLNEEPTLLIPISQLTDGKWQISVFFTYKGKNYYKKEDILL